MFCSFVTPDKFLIMHIKAAHKVEHHTQIDLESSAHVPPFIIDLPHFLDVILWPCLDSPTRDLRSSLRCFCYHVFVSFLRCISALHDYRFSTVERGYRNSHMTLEIRYSQTK